MSSTSGAEKGSMGSTSPADKGMIKVMAMVLGTLLLFTLFCVLMARLLGFGGADGSSSTIMRNALMQRIEPVGKVRTSVDDLPAEQQAGGDAAAGGEQVASAKTGEELVQGACAACHAAGVAGAPKIEDSAEWEKRREAGLDALVASVTNGKGAMPARGGSSYSDEELKLAVQHMAGFEVDEPAAKEGQSSDAGGAAPAEGEGGEQAAEGDSGDKAAPGGDVDLVAMIGSGEAPEGMSDNVKTAVDGICAGCHVAGVANAPKLGDKEAWTPRAEMGLAALTESVTNGKAAMPANGGSQLTEEEIPVAVQYLISKNGS